MSATRRLAAAAQLSQVAESAGTGAIGTDLACDQLLCPELALN
jgi:hypothetical protein